ncbi:hypothetical protein ACIBEJ_43655 [Nonomuraea sp. NPDC050790]|uniref:hypothetical protein n=1 Tax=Nonomuraea sp. NPDC050790 TaxID=3364371 RepID=UPI0037BAFA72
MTMDIGRNRLRTAARSYDNERLDLDEHVQRARAELNAIGAFWGGTREGVLFFKGEGGGRGYEAHTDQIAKGLHNLDEAHEQLAERLRLMGDLVRFANWESIADLLSRLPEPEENPKVWGSAGEPE